MQMVTGRGPEKISLELERTPLLSGKADWSDDECVSLGLASVVCRWRSEDLSPRDSGGNPLLGGSNTLERRRTGPGSPVLGLSQSVYREKMLLLRVLHGSESNNTLVRWHRVPQIEGERVLRKQQLLWPYVGLALISPWRRLPLDLGWSLREGCVLLPNISRWKVWFSIWTARTGVAG